MILSFAFVLALGQQEPAPAASPAPAPAPADGTQSEEGDIFRKTREKEAARKPVEPQPECSEPEKESKGPNVAAITGIVGSATGTAGAAAGIIVALVQVPAPWQYYGYAQKLGDAEAAYKKHPQAKYLEQASDARHQMAYTEKAYQGELGLLLSSGAALVTAGVGLASSIIVVATGE